MVSIFLIDKQHKRLYYTYITCIHYIHTVCVCIESHAIQPSFHPTWCCHVCGPCWLDLFHVSEALFAEQLVKVCDDFVEQSQALDSLVVALQLHVELGEVGDGGEHDADRVALLVVQLLPGVRGTCVRDGNEQMKRLLWACALDALHGCVTEKPYL